MTVEEKVEGLNAAALREHGKSNIKPFKSYEDAFRRQAEYLLELMQSVTAQRNASTCTKERLLALLKTMPVGTGMSESDMRELLIARKGKIGWDEKEIQAVFGAAASTGVIIRNGKSAVVKLYSHKLSLERTKKLLNALLPVGTDTQYVLSGGEWGYFEGKGLSFSQLDAMGLTWEELDGKEW